MIKKNKYGIIYLIRNKINNKVYIGQTIKSFNKRYAHNLYAKTHNSHLKYSIDKYGIDNFEIIEELDVAYSKEDLDMLEDMYINKYKSTDSKYGYNKKSGGANGRPNGETLRKLSESHIGINTGAEHPNAKKVVLLNTGEIFDTITDAHNKYSSAGIGKISSCCSNKRNSAGTDEYGYKLVWLNYNDYINLTQEDIEGMINKANLDKKGVNSKSSKRIICITTGEIFECMKDACDKYNISNGSLSSACNGKYKYCGKDDKGNKLVWKYYKDYINMSEEDVKSSLDTAKNSKSGGRAGNASKVICITTGKIFECIKDAQEYYKCNNVSGVCRGKNRYAGKLPDGTKLEWMYYDKYLELNKDCEEVA